MYCSIACVEGILIGLKFSLEKKLNLNQYGRKKIQNGRERRKIIRKVVITQK